MRTVSYRLLVVLLACGLPLVLTDPAHADPPSTLADALKRSTYPVRRTPLILVDAEGTHWSLPTKQMQQKLERLYEGDDAKPSFTDILDCYNSQIVSCSSVQVVAPMNRIVVEPYSGSLDQDIVANPDQAAKLLLGSLTAAQWEMATSSQGIGLSDLSKPEQKAAFRSIIREPFKLTQLKNGDGSSNNFSDTGVERVIPSEQVRIQVGREMSWYYRTQRNGFESSRHFSNAIFAGKKPDELFWVNIDDSWAKSQNNRKREPNKLKDSDISFNSSPLYGCRISLQGVKTVGELVQQVAEQTGIELYADRRLSGLKLTVISSGDTPTDAADVMKALCYAVCGTIRKVADDKNTVYILTKDRKGMAPVWLRRAEWSADVEALTRKINQDFANIARGKEFAARIGFAEDSPKISPELMAQAEAKIASGESFKQSGAFTRLPVSELPAEIQQQITADLNSPRAVDRNGEKINFDRDNIYAQFRFNTYLLVPGYGSFNGPQLTNLNTVLQEPRNLLPEAKKPNVPTGPIPIPEGLSEFPVLKITPQSDAETDKAIDWEVKHGFKALFVKVSLWDNTDRELLAHAVNQGAANGIKIFPSVSLLRVPVVADSKSDAAFRSLRRTCNLLGETLPQYGARRKNAIAVVNEPKDAKQIDRLRQGDWLDAGDGEVRQLIAERLHAIAKVPGIAGIVLDDGTAPGYELPDSYTPDVKVGQQGGYNEELRISLIRQENIDPIDLLTGREEFDKGSIDETLSFPVFHKDTATGAWKVDAPIAATYEKDIAGWGMLRREKNRQWIGQIRSKAALPKELSVYWQAPADGGLVGVSPWAALWKSEDYLPPLWRSVTAPMGNLLLTSNIQPTVTAESMRSWLAVDLTNWVGARKPQTYSGWVIDITNLDTDNALTLLDCLAPVSKTK